MEHPKRQERLLIHAGWVIRAKVAICTTLITVMWVIWFTGLLEFPLLLFCIPTALAMTINLPYHGLIRRAGSPERIFSITATFDVLIITAAAHALGDLGKFLALLVYPLVFIFAGTVLASNKTFLFANLGFVCVVVLTYLERTGLLMSVETKLFALSNTECIVLFSIVFPIYNFMAFFVQHLSGTLREREHELVEKALRDELTGLSSQALFMERLRQALIWDEAAQVEGREASMFAVLFLDLDRFKMINNSYGHAVGDQLLVEVSRRLEMCVKSVDTVAHMGGDEYTVLLESLKVESEPSRVAEMMQQLLAARFDLDGHEVFLGASIGIALSSTGYKVPENMLRDAHTAMYRAKALGHGRVEVFDAEMRSRVVSRLDVETDLRHAIERQELRLYYQPIIAIESGSLACFEALVRWQHPERGLVMPDEFIRIAEDSGFIIPLGRWVLREACLQLKHWHETFSWTMLPEMCVNLSGEQLKSRKLSQEVDKILQDTGADPRYLNLEITESVLLEETELPMMELARLRDLDVHLALDDFGTGYSSLSYLRHLNVDTLKIDRSFIRRLDGPGKDLEVVRTMILMAHGLDMSVVAEGVETDLQLEFLKNMDCDYAQGFHFAHPMTVADAERYIERMVAVP